MAGGSAIEAAAVVTRLDVMVDLPEESVADLLIKYPMFCRKWGIPASAATLKMFMAVTFAHTLNDAQLCDVSPYLWEHWYRQVLARTRL